MPQRSPERRVVQIILPQHQKPVLPPPQAWPKPPMPPRIGLRLFEGIAHIQVLMRGGIGCLALIIAGIFFLVGVAAAVKFGWISVKWIWKY